MVNKKLTLGFCIALITILFMLAYNVNASNTVTGAKKLCLSRGEIIPDSQHPRFTCKHQLCQVCVDDKNYPIKDSHCNQISKCTPLTQNNNTNPTVPINTNSTTNSTNKYTQSMCIKDVTNTKNDCQKEAKNTNKGCMKNAGKDKTKKAQCKTLLNSSNNSCKTTFSNNKTMCKKYPKK